MTMLDLTAYIATIWTENEENGIERFLVRGWANSPEDFANRLRLESADDTFTIGPIGVSKDQEGRGWDTRNVR